MTKINAELIDQLLPQTQCGLCHYAGCMPYAEALAKGKAPPDLCLPGGVPVLQKLGAALEINIDPYLAEMAIKTKSPVLAQIREAECIGCTKCIQACPVDAIIGSAKQMHSIIPSLCTGCQLCVPPCPVDCIDLLATSPTIIPSEKTIKARKQYNNRLNRLEKLAHKKSSRAEKNETYYFNEIESENLMDTETLQPASYIQEALARVKSKKKRDANPVLIRSKNDVN